MIVMFTALVGDKVRAHTRSKNNYLYFIPFVCAVLNKLTMNGLKRDDDGDVQTCYCSYHNNLSV